jgi:hypothetical protein
MKPTSSFSREELLQIARSQETIINLILVNLLLGLCFVVSVMILGPNSTSGRIMILLVRGTILVINIIAVVFIFRLAKALHKTAGSMPWRLFFRLSVLSRCCWPTTTQPKLCGQMVCALVFWVPGRATWKTFLQQPPRRR